MLSPKKYTFIVICLAWGHYAKPNKSEKDKHWMTLLIYGIWTNKRQYLTKFLEKDLKVWVIRDVGGEVRTAERWSKKQISNYKISTGNVMYNMTTIVTLLGVCVWKLLRINPKSSHHKKIVFFIFFLMHLYMIDAN